MTYTRDTKKIANNSLFLYLRMLLVMIVTLYTSRVVLKVLGVEDFGIYNVVGGVVSFLSFFISTLSNVTQRYLSIGISEGNLIKTNRYFSQSIIIYICIILMLLLFGETIGTWFVENKLTIPSGREKAAYWTFQFCLLTIVFSILQIPYMSDIIAREKMSLYAYIGIIEVFLKLISAFVLYKCGDFGKVSFYAFLVAVSSLITFLIYSIYCYRLYPECRFKFHWDGDFIKESSKFIGYNLYGCLAYSAGSQGNNILLNINFGPIVNAARGISMQVSGAVLRFTDGIMSAVKPQIIKSYSSNDLDYMKMLIVKSTLFSFLLMFLISFPLYINIGFVINLWLGEIPQYCIPFSRLVIIEMLLSVLANPLWMAVNATGKIKRNQLYGRTFYLLTLPVSWILLRYFHNPYVPFIVCILAQFVYWLYSFWDVSQQIKLDFKYYLIQAIIPISFISLIIILFGLILISTIKLNYLLFIVSCLCLPVLTIMLTFFIAIKKTERTKLINYCVSKLHLRR